VVWFTLKSWGIEGLLDAEAGQWTDPTERCAAQHPLIYLDSIFLFFMVRPHFTQLHFLALSIIIAEVIYTWVYPKVSGLSYTRWKATQRIMIAKLTRLTHKMATQLRLVADSCTFCTSRSRRPVRKLLDTPSYWISCVPFLKSWQLNSSQRAELKKKPNVESNPLVHLFPCRN